MQWGVEKQPERLWCIMTAFDAAALIAALSDDDPFCPEPPAEAAGWDEPRLRFFFESGGHDAGAGAAPPPPLLTREQARGWWKRRRYATVRLPADARAPQVFAKYPPPPAAEFGAWFPGLERCGVAPSQTKASVTLEKPNSKPKTKSLAGARRAARRPACGCCASPTRATRRMCTPTRGWGRARSPPCCLSAGRIPSNCSPCSCPGGATG